MTVPTGLAIAGTPITTSGTLALTLASGYSIPTDANQNVWTAKQPQLNGNGFVKASGTTISYDNSTYLTTESDPVWAAWLLTDPKPDLTRNLGSMAYARIDNFSPYNHTHDFSGTYATIGQEFYLGTNTIPYGDHFNRWKCHFAEISDHNWTRSTDRYGSRNDTSKNSPRCRRSTTGIGGKLHTDRNMELGNRYGYMAYVQPIDYW
jgi:hypothetical protein